MHVQQGLRVDGSQNLRPSQPEPLTPEHQPNLCALSPNEGVPEMTVEKKKKKVAGGPREGLSEGVPETTAVAAGP